MAESPQYNSEVDSLSWFHSCVSRHHAESMLLHNGTEGSYLLRQSMQQHLTLSVRFVDSVRHFPITWNGQQYKFGMATFNTFSQFKQHFDNKPILKGTGGEVVCLCHPYPNDVSEPHLYDGIMNQAELGQHACTVQSPHLSTATKEGFLLKRGEIVKNWKRRWFVISHNHLSYYKSKDATDAVKTIDLSECTRCVADNSLKQDFCFKLVFPRRVFYMCANSEEDKQEWIRLISWKVNQMNFESPVYMA